MSQVIGNMMVVDPLVIDFGWGNLKSGLACQDKILCTTAPKTGYLPDSQFNNPSTAAATRAQLIALYNVAMTQLEQGLYDQAKSKLASLQQAIGDSVKDPNQTALNLLITAQLAKFQ